jgi:hypothetical protein
MCCGFGLFCLFSSCFLFAERCHLECPLTHRFSLTFIYLLNIQDSKTWHKAKVHEHKKQMILKNWKEIKSRYILLRPCILPDILWTGLITYILTRPWCIQTLKCLFCFFRYLFFSGQKLKTLTFVTYLPVT